MGLTDEEFRIIQEKKAAAEKEASVENAETATENPEVPAE